MKTRLPFLSTTLVARIVVVIIIFLLGGWSFSLFQQIQQAKEFNLTQLKIKDTFRGEFLRERRGEGKPLKELLPWLEKWSKDKTIHYIALLDREGKMVGWYSSSGMKEYLLPSNLLKKDTEETLGRKVKREGKKLYETLTPLKLGGDLEGWLLVGHRSISSELTQDTIFYGIIFLVGLLFSITLVVTHLLRQTVINPLFNLKQALQDLRKGNFQKRFLSPSPGEIGELARAFNQMTQDLAKLVEIYKSSNPLTGLPGNNPISLAIDERIQSKKPFAVTYVDIDNFKAYNDHYGFPQGDRVIKFTGELISRTVKELGNSEDFVGHIGGDDFVFLTTPDKVEKISRKIITQFDQKIGSFYDPEAKERGWIEGKTREGEKKRFPLMSISLMTVTNERREFTVPQEIGKVAAELKKLAKSQKGSVWVKDRRSG